MDDERQPGVEHERKRDAFLPDDDRPGSDMGTGYDEVAAHDGRDDEGEGSPGVGDVYRSGS